jgi:GNAT superfamily N-acetyltransferase
LNVIATLRRVERAANWLPGVRWRYWTVLSAPFGSLRNAPAVSHDFSLEEIGLSQAAPLLEVNAAIPLPALQARFNAGNRCFLGRRSGRPVFYAWMLGNRSEQAIAARDHAEMHVDLRLGPGVCYYWDVFTHSDYRGRGVFALALSELANRLSTESFHTLTALVSVGNAASLRAFEKAGFSREAVLTHVQVFSRTARASRHEVDTPRSSEIRSS